MLKPCPLCKKKISEEAPTCPSCGQPLSAELWEKAAIAQKKSTKKRKIFLLGMAALLWYAIVNAPDENSPQYREETCHSESSAQAYAESIVSDYLKAPNTATFSKIGENHITYIGNCSHIVSGWVIAKNSFGVDLKNYYVAVTTYIKDKNRWTYPRLGVAIFENEGEAILAAHKMDRLFSSKD